MSSILGLNTVLLRKPDCPFPLITLWLHSFKEHIFQELSPLFYCCYFRLSNVLPWTYWKIRPFSFQIYVVMPSWIQTHRRPLLRVFYFLILAVTCYWISGQIIRFFCLAVSHGFNTLNGLPQASFSLVSCTWKKQRVELGDVSFGLAHWQSLEGRGRGECSDRSQARGKSTDIHCQLWWRKENVSPSYQTWGRPSVGIGQTVRFSHLAEYFLKWYSDVTLGAIKHVGITVWTFLHFSRCVMYKLATLFRSHFSALSATFYLHLSNVCIPLAQYFMFFSFGKIWSGQITVQSSILNC